MNLLILGATGSTGKLLVKLALENHHHVTVLVRNPERVGMAHEKLTVIKGDALNESDIAKSVEGKDAVICSLGLGNALKSQDLIFKAVSILIPSMQKANIKRLIMVSAFGVGETYEQANFLQKFAFSLPLKDTYRDKGKADELIRKSGLDWTIVCPVKLTNSPFTGKYKAGEKFNMIGFPTISRADVAHFMTGQLTDDSFRKKIVILKR